MMSEPTPEVEDFLDLEVIKGRGFILDADW